ncbi:MAG: hypothetical protein DRJ63_08015, partial [Thermoprotei archaeon]
VLNVKTTITINPTQQLINQAIRVANQIQNPFPRALALREIASTMAKAGLNPTPVLNQALRLANQIQYPYDRALVLAGIAFAMVGFGGVVVVGLEGGFVYVSVDGVFPEITIDLSCFGLNKISFKNIKGKIEKKFKVEEVACNIVRVEAFGLEYTSEILPPPPPPVVPPPVAVAAEKTILETSVTHKTILVDYSSLLSNQLNLAKRLSVNWSKSFSFKSSLSGFGGEWCCVKLGCGGWGCVYLAKQNGRWVVFKIPRGYESIIEGEMYPTLDSRLMERIAREAEVIRKLDHPNILRLLAYSNKYPLLVYEYANYGSLEYQLSQGWKPSLKEILLLGIQISDALRYIHSRGLIHCDIKPSNVFFVDRVAKLGDFSALVKLLAMTSSHSRFAYTPGFAAPEQRYIDLRKKVIELGYENRIDIYQLGNLLLYLLTGETVDGEYVYDQRLVEGVVGRVECGELRELIKLMLSENALDRPSADEVVKYLVKIYRSL